MTWFAIAASLMVGITVVGADAADMYEWHSLVAAPGKLDELHARLRDRVLPAVDDPDRRTVAVLTPAGENADGVVHLVVAGDRAGGQFATEAEWPAWLADGEARPPIATHRSVQRLRTTAWSPNLVPTQAAAPRVFELRTYTSPDARRREALLTRFERHTMSLFTRHGMTNVIYWTPIDGPDAETMLVYLLAHDSQEAAKASFDAFRKDPEWVAAKTASEAAAGGSLTIKEKGVISQFLMPAAYSPLR